MHRQNKNVFKVYTQFVPNLYGLLYFSTLMCQITCTCKTIAHFVHMFCVTTCMHVWYNREGQHIDDSIIHTTYQLLHVLPLNTCYEATATNLLHSCMYKHAPIYTCSLSMHDIVSYLEQKKFSFSTTRIRKSNIIITIVYTVCYNHVSSLMMLHQQRSSVIISATDSNSKID